MSQFASKGVQLTMSMINSVSERVQMAAQVAQHVHVK